MSYETVGHPAWYRMVGVGSVQTVLIASDHRYYSNLHDGAHHYHPVMSSGRIHASASRRDCALIARGRAWVGELC